MVKVENKIVIAGVSIFLFLAAFLWTTHQILYPVLVGGLLLLILFSIRKYPLARQLAFAVIMILVIWFLAKAQGLIFPFVISFVLAYLFDPLADRLEGWRIPRTLAALIILILSFGVLTLVGIILIPSLINEIKELMEGIPELANSIFITVQENLPKLLAFVRIDSQDLQQSVLETFPARAEQVLLNILRGISGVSSFLGPLFNVIHVPILTFYFLKDFNHLRSGLLGFIPRRYHNIISFYQWRVNRILGGYIRGQLIVCTIVGILTGAGFAILKIPFAVLLGFLTGLLNIIPFVGLYISLGLSLLTGFFTPDPFITMLKIACVFFGVQMLEAYIISPKIVGDRVGLHPVVVIFSILAFSRFLGFWGLIIGVPTAALIKFLIDEWKRRQKWREILAEKKASAN